MQHKRIPSQGNESPRIYGSGINHGNDVEYQGVSSDQAGISKLFEQVTGGVGGQINSKCLNSFVAYYLGISAS